MPLLFSSVLVWLREFSRSPAFDPGDVVSENAAEVARGFVKGKSVDGRPKLQLISVAAAFVAVVASGVQVHRERSTLVGRGAVNRARPMQLIASALRGLEVQSGFSFKNGWSLEQVEEVAGKFPCPVCGAEAGFSYGETHWQTNCPACLTVYSVPGERPG